MARIRTIKPEFWSDEKLGPLHPLDRVVFLGLISMADDLGRVLDNIKQIDAFIFPYTDDTARQSLSELENIERIRRGKSTNGLAIIQIVNWHHQKIDKPNFSSCLPSIKGDPEDAASAYRKSKRIPERIKDLVWQRDKACCQKCGRTNLRRNKLDRYDAGQDLGEIDHRIEAADGGSNEPENLQLLCLPCNRKKAGVSRTRRNEDRSGEHQREVSDHSETIRRKVADDSPTHTNDHVPTTNDQRSTTSSPARAHEGPTPGPEEEEATRLSIALKGKVLDPAEFAVSVARTIGTSHGNRAFDAWVDMSPSKRTDWLLVAWDKAIAANAKVRSKYVAGVIGSALVDGIDLTSPGDQGSCAAPPPPPPIDPQIARERLARQLAPLLIRSGMTRPEADAFLRDAHTDALEARLAELRASTKEVDRGAA